jgi:hypothetical protein
MNTLANSATSFSPNFADLSNGLLTTVIWGTDGQGTIGSFSYSAYGSYIVTSGSDSKRVEEIDIEQGSGLEATRIQLIQGRRYTMTVVDDTNMTPPSFATKLSFEDTISGGAALYLFQLIENGDSTVRKAEHKRELTVEYLTCIEGAGTIPVV